MKSTHKFAAAALFAAVMFLPHTLTAQQSDAPAPVEDPAIEEELEISSEEEFVRYCSVCHGLDAKGKGPLAANLKTPPADLTQISKRNNGGFPLGKVADIIRNGGNLSGHGSTDMPAWGEAFRDHEEPIMVSALIFELALFLESIQER